MTRLSEQSADLPDDHAIAALALVLERTGRPVDPFSGRETETHLREALEQPDVCRPWSRPTPTRRPVNSLAPRCATSPTRTRRSSRAITITPASTRFDPATLAVGTLVLMAFHADINLERDPEKGWKFHFRTKPLSDSTIGKLLGQLLGVFTEPKP